MLVRTLLPCVPIVIPAVAAAQSGGTAHLYAYTVKDRAAFEAGYRQHLRWHAAHADKLAWFAWYVTNGDRAGAFVDGTFGTTPDGLSGRPDPKGDGADFRINAGPHVSAIGDEGWQLWREASRATPLEQRRPVAYTYVYMIAAEDKAAFEAAIAAQPLRGATWYRGLDGAPGRYLLMLPARSRGAPPPLSLSGGPVRTLRAETWEYVPRLALLPGAPAPLIARGKWRLIASGPLIRSDPSMRFLPLALLLVATPAIAQDLAPAETAKVDSIVTDTLARNGVPSASIAIVRGGRIVYAKAYGKQSETIATPHIDAPYQIASISKQFTAAAILMLEDEGKLSLDDTVAKWVPGITDGDKITIRQLLSHTSGLQDYWPQDYSFAAMEKPVTPQQIVDRWAKKPLDFAPGTQWQYSNTGYVVAGMIVEKAAGKPLLAYLQDKVFKPLGMKVIDQDLAVGKGFPQGYHRYALGPVRVEKPAARGWLFAAGELAMSASDLAKWDIARLNRSVMPADDWQVQETPILLTSGKSTNYGLGVFTGIAKGHRYVEHTGEAVGFLSENIVYPDDKAAVVVLVNSDFSDAFTGIASQISELILPPPSGPAAGGDAETAKTAQARAIFDQLRTGKLDRATMTEDANYYFDATAVGDYRDSLGKLGDPASFTLTRPARLRGGFVNRNYTVTYPNGTKLSVVTYAEPEGAGRYEQFIVMPAD